MGVAVDQAGQDGGAAKVDDRGARRRLDRSGIADGNDAVALDEDSRLRDRWSPGAVDQGPTADHGKTGTLRASRVDWHVSYPDDGRV